METISNEKQNRQTVTENFVKVQDRLALLVEQNEQSFDKSISISIHLFL